MLLTRALPPSFLLPSRGARQLAQKLQRACISDSASGSSPKPRRIRTRQRQLKPQGPSLFDKLFPEEKETVIDDKTPKVDKLPPFQFDSDFEKVNPEVLWGKVGEATSSAPAAELTTVDANVEEKVPLIAHDEQEDRRKRREAAVLVLNSASKRLEESDFFRIGHKGTHIQGWTTGIIKVIQARDESTLEPLGSYFILFSSVGAAKAYLDQTIRLHRISRSLTGSLIASTLPPPRQLVREGEDPREIVKSFTLVPGNGRLSLRLINRPYKPGTIRMLNEGGTHAISTRQSKGQGLVLLSLDIGSLRMSELRDIIGLDGKRRNLHWMLANDPIIKLEARKQDIEEDETTEEMMRTQNGFRAPSKYMIAFKDRNEARRFVMEWHRRPLPFQRPLAPGDEAPPIANVQILW